MSEAKPSTPVAKPKNVPPRKAAPGESDKWYLILVNIHQRDKKRTVSALASRIKEIGVNIPSLDDPIEVSPKAWRKVHGVQQFLFPVRMSHDEYLILKQKLANKALFEMSNASFGEAVLPVKPVDLNARVLSGSVNDIDGKPDYGLVRWILETYSLEFWTEKEN